MLRPASGGVWRSSGRRPVGWRPLSAGARLLGPRLLLCGCLAWRCGPLLSAEPRSGGGVGPPAAAAPLGAAQPLQRRGPWARPLLESPGAAAR